MHKRSIHSPGARHFESALHLTQSSKLCKYAAISGNSLRVRK
jgi:hypothetical protein